MSKETTLVILGIFVAILPFLGFPESWRVVMFVMCGLGVTALGFLLRADHLHHESPTVVSVAKTRTNRASRAVASDISVSPVASDNTTPPSSGYLPTLE